MGREMLSLAVLLKQSHYGAPRSITLLSLTSLSHISLSSWCFPSLELNFVLSLLLTFLLSIELPPAPTRKYFQRKPHSWSGHVCPTLLQQHWPKQCGPDRTGSKDTGGSVCGAFSVWERIQFEITPKEPITVKFICNWLLRPILFCAWIEAWL